MPIDAPETKMVHTRRVACDGGEGHWGTPGFGCRFQKIRDGSNAPIATANMSMPKRQTAERSVVNHLMDQSVDLGLHADIGLFNFL